MWVLTLALSLFCTARASPLASLSSFVRGTVIAGPALVL